MRHCWPTIRSAQPRDALKTPGLLTQLTFNLVIGIGPLFERVMIWSPAPAKCIRRGLIVMTGAGADTGAGVTLAGVDDVGAVDVGAVFGAAPGVDDNGVDAGDTMV